jgi:hypothetical protein
MSKRKNIWNLLGKRYKSTIINDFYRVKNYFSYYWEDPITWEEFFSHYPWDLALIAAREIFRWTVVWPFMMVFCSFSTLVRYIFILWHWIFADIILYQLAIRNYKYPFKFFRLIYKMGSWIEQFIINYFGIGLFFSWVKRKIDAVPDWILGKLPSLVRNVDKSVEIILWIARKYDRGFDYLVSFLDPWSYRKTRYMLSRKYRMRLWLIFKWHKARFLYFLKRQPLRLKGYGAIWIYRFKVFWFDIKFFFRVNVRKAYWARFYYAYWGGFKLFFSENLMLFTSWCWQNVPFLFYRSLPIFYRINRWPLRFRFPFYRFIHNYYYSRWWRWSKKETKSIKKTNGKWKIWFSIWKQWAAKRAKKK